MLVRLRRRLAGDEGSTLIVVLVVMLVLTTGALTLAAIVTNTAVSLAHGRSTVQSRGSADAGLAAAVSQARRTGDFCALSLTSSTDPKYTVTSSCASNQVTFTSTGTASGGVTKSQQVFAYNPASTNLTGALVSASGSINASSLLIAAPNIDGDLILNSGNVDCNNSTVIQGDLIVRNGFVTLSNQCQVKGSVYASQYVQIQNNAVGVGGDVSTPGSFTLSTAATIGGTVTAGTTANISSAGKINGSVVAVGNVAVDGSGTIIGGAIQSGGTVTVNSSAKVGSSVVAVGNVTHGGNATIGGDIRTGGTASLNAGIVTGTVYAASASTSSFYGSTVGGISIGGGFSSFQATTVNGNVQSKAAVSSQIAPDVKITGTLKLGGTYTTWSSGPTVTGGITQNATGLVAPVSPTAPTYALPAVLQPNAFTWTDLPYTTNTWQSSGYTILPWTKCDFQNDATASAAVNALTSPTVLDLTSTSCSGNKLNLYQATLKLKTNIAFVLKSGTDFYAQGLKIQSADGLAHAFNVIIPDNTADKAATCSSSSTVTLTNVIMDSKISGLAYSPCTIQIGQAGSGSTWNGQVYAGTVSWGGNSSPPMTLNYQTVNVPSFNPSTGGGSGSGGSGTLTALVSQRDIP